MKVTYYAKQIFLPIVLFILPLLLVQCAVPPSPVFQKDGRVYGKTEGQWGGQWWNYYQRGLSYSQGGFWEYAIKDLHEALGKRPVDQRRARTYGLHILDDYFPHRELGIVYYHQQKYVDAIVELEASLKQTESAKAKYFLNQAREGNLRQSGADQFPPSISISEPRPGSLTRFSTIEISGVVSDDQFVKSLSINGRETNLELSSPTFTFSSSLDLQRGENRIIVESYDLLDRKAQQEITVWCDQDAPLIYIDRIKADKMVHTCTVDGYITDMIGVAGLWLNGQPVHLPETGDVQFLANLYMEDIIESISFEAKDILGNRTTGEIKIGEITEGRALTRLASAGADLRGISPLFASSDTPSKSTPFLKLKELPERLTVDWDACFLEGEARDSDGIKGITINSTPLITRAAKLVFFNYLVPLEPGDNLITIQAEGLSGEIETKQIVVTRKLDPVHSIGSRWHLAIVPLKYQGEREELDTLIYDTLLKNFVSQRRFWIVDRERVDGYLKRFKERENDEPWVVELGRLVAAEGVIAGNAYFYDNHLEIIARATDTESSVVMDAEDVFGPVTSLKDVDLLAEGLALKFKQAFPVVEGKVIGRDAEIIKIDLGKERGISPYMKVVFFREGMPIRLVNSNRILEKKVIELGEGQIKRVYDSYSDILLINEKDDARIKLDDLLITK